MPAQKNPPAGQRGEKKLTNLVKKQTKCAPPTQPRQPLRQRLSDHTLRQVAALLHCTEAEAINQDITIQTFDDSKEKDRRKARLLHGRLSDQADNLDLLNQQGCGIFIAVNQTDLLGRSKENVVALRAQWADVDGNKARQELDLSSLALQPSLVVKSGHGTHLYWIFPEAIPCGEERRQEHTNLQRGIQKQLAAYGADPAIVEHPEGVLRLAGFYNMKAEPVLVVVMR